MKCNSKLTNHRAVHCSSISVRQIYSYYFILNCKEGKIQCKKIHNESNHGWMRMVFKNLMRFNKGKLN